MKKLKLKKLSKKDMVGYFRDLSAIYEIKAHRENDSRLKLIYNTKAECYELAAHAVEMNMK